MATPSYMTIVGTKQGLITAGSFTVESVGSGYQNTHKDEVMIYSFEHESSIAHNEASGQLIGTRTSKPLRVVKPFDKSSPLLQNAHTSGELLTKVLLKWYRISASGTPEHYYTTTLEDALIVRIKDGAADSNNSLYPTPVQKVYFSYRKITWTHEASCTSGSDDWSSPAAAG